MAEYIEREAVLDEYDRQHNGPPGGARKIIAEFPAADVRPVVRGRWIDLDECSNEGVYCSNCQKKVYKFSYSNTMKRKSNFCPNCGAKMDKED